MRCIASRAFICITNRIRYAIDTAYCATSGPGGLEHGLVRPRRVLHHAVPLVLEAGLADLSAGVS